MEIEQTMTVDYEDIASVFSYEMFDRQNISSPCGTCLSAHGTTMAHGTYVRHTVALAKGIALVSHGRRGHGEAKPRPEEKPETKEYGICGYSRQNGHGAYCAFGAGCRKEGEERGAF